MAEKHILLDGLMAKVNAHSITIGDVMLQVQPLQRQLVAKYKGEDLRRETRKLFQKALDNLIENKLIIDAYKEQKGQIPEWVVDNRISEILHEMFNDDRTAMLRALAKDNLTYNQWKANVRNQIIVSSMRQTKVQERIKISAADVKKYYDSHIDEYKDSSAVWLEVIVFKISVTDDIKVTMQKALDLQQKLKSGGDFAVAAKEFSQGYGKEKGGDWGWIEIADLREELQIAQSKLKIDEISEVVETEDSLYILKVAERNSGLERSFVEVREKIEEKLRNKEGRRIHKEWIASLKKKAQVEIVDIDPFVVN